MKREIKALEKDGEEIKNCRDSIEGELKAE